MAAAEEGQVIGCHTVEAWNEQLQKSNETKQLVVRLFFFILLLFHFSPFFFQNKKKEQLDYRFGCCWFYIFVDLICFHLLILPFDIDRFLIFSFYVININVSFKLKTSSYYLTPGKIVFDCWKMIKFWGLSSICFDCYVGIGMICRVVDE